MTNYQQILYETTDENLYNIFETQNKTKKYMEESCEQIKDWYNMQPHLPKDALDDRILLRYFYICKYSIERTKEKVDMYFSGRSIFPEILANRNTYDHDILNSIKSCEYLQMPRITENKHRLFIMRFTDKDPKYYDPLTGFKYITMMAEIRLAYDSYVGDEYVWDLTNLKLSHVVKTTPTLIKKILFIAQNCFVSKIRAIHIINCPGYGHTSINIVKTVIKKKIADRIILYNSMEDFHKSVHPKYLPKELGGELSSCEKYIQNCISVMQSDEWSDYFNRCDFQKSDESKRPNKSDDRVGDLLGITGSFKKLDID